jgi:hypothetical protein
MQTRRNSLTQLIRTCILLSLSKVWGIVIAKIQTVLWTAYVIISIYYVHREHTFTQTPAHTDTYIHTTITLLFRNQYHVNCNNRMPFRYLFNEKDLVQIIVKYIFIAFPLYLSIDRSIYLSLDLLSVSAFFSLFLFPRFPGFIIYIACRFLSPADRRSAVTTVKYLYLPLCNAIMPPKPCHSYLFVLSEPLFSFFFYFFFTSILAHTARGSCWTNTRTIILS